MAKVGKQFTMAMWKSSKLGLIRYHSILMFALNQGRSS
jgi:hypothetical protein